MINNQADKRSVYWQQQVEAWRTSKLSQTKFCQNQSLGYNQFVYWRRKLESATQPVQKIVDKRGFTQVNPVRNFGAELSLTLPNGVIVRGVSESNWSVVQKLLENLG